MKLKIIPTQARSSFNEKILERDKERISSVLKNIGYYFPKIDIFIEDLKDNKINLTYKIDIGEKQK